MAEKIITIILSARNMCFGLVEYFIAMLPAYVAVAKLVTAPFQTGYFVGVI